MKLIDLEKINFVEKKRTYDMNKNTEEAANSLLHIIVYEGNKGPLRWAEDMEHNIYICNSDYDRVCRVQIYATSPKNSPIGAYYYVYFNGKYRNVAKKITYMRIDGITEADGFKFTVPKSVTDFVTEVINIADGVKEEPMKKDCKTEAVLCSTRGCGKTAFQMFQCYRESLGIMDWLDIINRDSIEDVIFNDPATIVKWSDGTKTVVKAENEPFDPEKGLAMAISKRVLGNKYDYYDVFKKYVGRYEKKQKKGKNK